MKRENASIKGQDCLILAKIILCKELLSQRYLARETLISEAEVSFSIKRLRKAHLLLSNNLIPRYADCSEFFIHAVKFFFPASSTGVSVGLPTAHSNPFFNYVNSAGGIPYVWSYAGNINSDEFKLAKGENILPIYKTIPLVSLMDFELYKFFSLLDMIRVGRARERNIARKEIADILKEKAWSKSGQATAS